MGPITFERFIVETHSTDGKCCLKLWISKLLLCETTGKAGCQAKKYKKIIILITLGILGLPRV